jgi:hypothetical protein
VSGIYEHNGDELYGDGREVETVGDLQPDPKPAAGETKYPEHEKLHAVKDKSQAIGEFIDWLREEHNVHLGRSHSHEDSGCERETDKSGFRFWNCGMQTDQYEHERRNVVSFMAEFFDIDLDKIEMEKRAMLDSLRKAAV